MKAYNTFASGGYSIEPYFITKVEDINGNILYERKDKKQLILNESVVYILNNLMKNSYNKALIDYAYPTCINIAPKLTKDYAIKTGTTNTDHLIFGYNKDAILGIWMGYDDNSETEVKDGTIMKNIWADIIEDYLKDKDNNWYEQPDNVVGVIVDPISGEIATDYNKSTTFYYIKGTQPLFDENLSDLLPDTKKS